MLTTTITGKTMILNYDRKTEKTSYYVCDLNGNELFAGTLPGSSPHSLELEGLPAGIYCLCLVDGDQLHKARFSYP